MDVYIKNEFGEYVPFDLELYEQKIRSEAYATARERNKLRNKRKKQIKAQRIFGLILIMIVVISVKFMINIGETDVTYAAILLPLSGMIAFGRIVAQK